MMYGTIQAKNNEENTNKDNKKYQLQEQTLHLHSLPVQLDIRFLKCKKIVCDLKFSGNWFHKLGAAYLKDFFP